MSDILTFPGRGLPPEARDELEMKSAAAAHLMMAAGDIGTLQETMGNGYALPNRLATLRSSLKDGRILVECGGDLHVRTDGIPSAGNDGLVRISRDLHGALEALSSPAAVKRLLEIGQDEILLAGGDILGTLNERKGMRWNSGLAEQTAWLLAMESRNAAEEHLSFLDEEANSGAAERSSAEKLLRAAVERKSEIEDFGTPNISGRLIEKAIHQQKTRISDIHENTIRAISRRIDALTQEPGAGPDIPLAAVMSEAISQRTGALCLSEFDFRRMPASIRADLLDRRVVHRLAPGKGVLQGYDGPSLRAPESHGMTQFLSARVSSQETQIKLAAIGANILRRNRVVVGASAHEADAFLEAAKLALRQRPERHVTIEARRETVR